MDYFAGMDVTRGVPIKSADQQALLMSHSIFRKPREGTLHQPV